jgi:hypothetical protein
MSKTNILGLFSTRPTVTIEQLALGQTMMGTGHYYFDQMRSLVQNQLFALTKLNIYKTNCLNLSNGTSMAAVQKKGT